MTDVTAELVAVLERARHTLVAGHNYRVTDLDVETFEGHLKNGVPRDRLEFMTDYSADIEAIDAALARAKGGEWRHPSDVPQVKAGQPDWRIVAVRRAHNGQIYRFPALYLDKVSLWFEDDNEERSVTGWFSPVSGEDGETYHELLGEGDVLEAWRDLPSAPSDAILAALQEPGHG